MLKILLTTFSFLSFNLIQAQFEDKAELLKVDINNNGIFDEFKPMQDVLEMKIDNKKYSLKFEDTFGFQHLSELSYENNILIISGGNEGTGAWLWTYKFRHNKLTNKIELIGYDDFNKWVSGNATTSYNLITGQYKVIVEEYDKKKQLMVPTTHKGKKMVGKIILTELRKEDLKKLGEIGIQYAPK